MVSATTDERAAAIVRGVLDPSERLVWAGQPWRGIALHRADVFMIPFSLVWMSGVGTAAVAAFINPTFLLFRIWLLAFVSAGLYFVIGRFIVDAWRRAGTFYGLSDERMLIVTRLLGSSVTSRALDDLGEITVRAGRGGRGTIYFGNLPPFLDWGQSGLGGRQLVTPSFEMIPDVEAVAALIRRARQEARRRDW